MDIIRTFIAFLVALSDGLKWLGISALSFVAAFQSTGMIQPTSRIIGIVTAVLACRYYMSKRRYYVAKRKQLELEIENQSNGDKKND